MIRITDAIAIDEREVEESFVRAGGPGGQNVNKLATAVQLRFDVRRSASLPEQVRVRLERLAGRRLTQDGVLIITAQRHRTQERNRQDALERLVELIRRAALPPTPRLRTKPTAGAKRRPLEAKKPALPASESPQHQARPPPIERRRVRLARARLPKVRAARSAAHPSGVLNPGHAGAGSDG